MISIKLSIVVYVAYGVMIFINQRDIIYFPKDKVKHVFNEVIFHNEKESINVIVLNDKKEKTILYFGGNSGKVV